MTNTDIAAAALREAQQLLADAWRQLDLAGKTETDPADAALSAAMNEIRAIRNSTRIDPADEDAQIVHAATEARARQSQAEATRDELHELIRRSGQGPSRLGELAGLSPQRIAQIRRGTRTW